MTQDGDNALTTASLSGKADVVQKLLDAGADVNVANKVRGETGLKMPCIVGTGLCGVFLEDGASE